MPIVTVQLGQCGNQLGASWFDTLAEELSQGSYGQHAADAYFCHQTDKATAPYSSKQWAARAVLVDMEPKVIYSAKQRALSSSYGWSYAAGSAISGQSGSGNNWALGHNKYGPAMAPAVLEAVRKQVEACDTFEGFLMLQSMAGGTGAGAGTYLSEALVDEYSNAHLLNCCVWPYASGEVTVQPYNTLLTMSCLAEVSSGILLLQNEVLHATCTRLLGIQHPGFKDLNAVAAKSLASTLLPCRARPAAAAAAATAGSPPFPAHRNVTTSPGSRITSPGTASSSSSSSGSLASRGPVRPSSTSWGGSGISQLQLQLQHDSSGLGVSGVGQPLLHPMADLTCHLFSHPSYRLASLRSVPQVAAASKDFTTYTWPALLRRLRAMGLAGAYLEQGLSGFMTSSSSSVPLHRYKNRAASSMLILRGSEAASVPVPEFEDPNWHAPWAVDPLLVAAHSAKFSGCQMAATLLATDQACVSELQPMLAKAYSMHATRAYLHQYEAYGLGQPDFEQCFTAVEEVLAAYAAL